MPTDEVFIGVFCMVDAERSAVKKHSQAKRYPSEIVTLMRSFVIKFSRYRVFYRWISFRYRTLFQNAPH